MNRRTPADAVKAMWALLAAFDTELHAWGYTPLDTEQRACALDTTRTTESVGMFGDLWDRVLTGVTERYPRAGLLCTEINTCLGDMNPEAQALRLIHALLEAHFDGPVTSDDNRDTVTAIANTMLDMSEEYRLADADEDGTYGSGVCSTPDPTSEGWDR